ncbi:hypothetical protein ASPCADRAFT_395375 [Aspergillus carbonarius ITEM 5010]|uniref:Major facilitator superfamily (MFS) profile domain-containing protein n=1 Tax=Aspergillus carbonarius (strain ITEM 5010) TaxID=602072 RepID=A0A1R3RRJ6_ASPC5|nr:hypothetical protein ASPCADRAFT_395375 [Aspergillus carbonarius ITEM 5010]
MSNKTSVPTSTTSIIDKEKQHPPDDSSSEDTPAPKPSASNPNDFPDGGLQAWMVVAGSWRVMFASMGWINCVGSPSSVAWITSTETFIMFLGAPVFGKDFDNFGPRYMLLGGTVCHVLGLMMTSLASQYYQFFWPKPFSLLKNRAFAFGIISAGSSLAGVILPIIIPRLTPKFGFSWIMRTVAFWFLGQLIISNITIPPFKEPPFLLVALGSSIFFWGVFLPTNVIILQAQHDGMSNRLSGYLLSVLNAGSIPVLALWIPSHTNPTPTAFSALFGFTSGTLVSLIPAIVAQVTPDIRTIGVRNGANFFIISLAALAGNPIAGVLVQRDGGRYRTR